MPISLSEYARRPVLPRPISTSLTRAPPSRRFLRWSRLGAVPPCPATVVRRLDGHLDVVRVALGQSGRGDLDKPRVLQIGDGPGAAVAHGRAQPADQLAGHGGQRAAVRYLPLDAQIGRAH